MSSSPSSTMIPFERYDEEFASLTEQVTSKLRALDPRTTTSSSSSSSSSSADADVRMAHALLLQADDLLKQMGLEARGVEDPSVKRDLLGKVSCFLGVFWFAVVAGGKERDREEGMRRREGRREILFADNCNAPEPPGRPSHAWRALYSLRVRFRTSPKILIENK